MHSSCHQIRKSSSEDPFGSKTQSDTLPGESETPDSTDFEISTTKKSQKNYYLNIKREEDKETKFLESLRLSPFYNVISPRPSVTSSESEEDNYVSLK